MPARGEAKQPAREPVLSGGAALAAHFATRRFNLPDLHYQVVSRMVTGNIVVDHERITGLQATPVEAIVVYEVIGERIRTLWLFRPE